MLSDFRTPEKLFPENEDSSSTVKRATNSIFSNSTSRRRSCRSERRYTSQNTKVFDQVVPYIEDLDLENKSNKFLNFEAGHARKPSHSRQKSINDCQEISKLTLKKEASTRNTSKVSMYTEDSRSPCCALNPGESQSIIQGDEKNLHGFGNKENVRTSVGKSLQVIGNSPCAVYCRFCKVDVHSSVEYYNTRMSGGILKMFSSLFTCCNGPLWLCSMRVHKCPNCSLVLAKCR
jgi:hypothetical protein